MLRLDLQKFSTDGIGFDDVPYHAYTWADYHDDEKLRATNLKIDYPLKNQIAFRSGSRLKLGGHFLKIQGDALITLPTSVAAATTYYFYIEIDTTNKSYSDIKTSTSVTVNVGNYTTKLICYFGKVVLEAGTVDLNVTKFEDYKVNDYVTLTTRQIIPGPKIFDYPIEVPDTTNGLATDHSISAKNPDGVYNTMNFRDGNLQYRSAPTNLVREFEFTNWYHAWDGAYIMNTSQNVEWSPVNSHILQPSALMFTISRFEGGVITRKGIIQEVKVNLPDLEQYDGFYNEHEYNMLPSDVAELGIKSFIFSITGGVWKLHGTTPQNGANMNWVLSSVDYKF
jgi:hypothetical protein